ncbi:MAG: hypothetical protein HY692_03155 [Cyanobacteria bacterium NC_groundwater_1444_Ag_S-0.65um_54_12]|nr:hypothetical protein [Cyanobacteria bacterium NC_groundwater_1444_Ag_S-0.65um_54_12]
MEGISEVLAQQTRNTTALTPYQGNRPLAADSQLGHLRQLLAQLKQLSGQFPPEILAMLAGLIAEVQAVLAAGGPPVAIGSLIAKLEKIIHILMQLLQELATRNGQIDLLPLLAFLRGLIVQADLRKRAIIAKLIQALRLAIHEGSLKGTDELLMRPFPELSLVDATAANAVSSLQGLIALAQRGDSITREAPGESR